FTADRSLWINRCQELIKRSNGNYAAGRHANPGAHQFPETSSLASDDRAVVDADLGEAFNEMRSRLGHEPSIQNVHDTAIAIHSESLAGLYSLRRFASTNHRGQPVLAR